MWIIKAWQQISPELILKGFKKCCISNTVDGTNVDMLWNDRKRTGMLGASVRKMKALPVKMDPVTLVGKVDRISHAFCIQCMKLIAKFFS
jgi:hypothetical protein